MKNITEQLNRRFEPRKALLIYEREGCADETGMLRVQTESEIYVESYDIGRSGQPINAHPLSAKEMRKLAELFATAQAQKGGQLCSRGVLPLNVLHIRQQGEAFAVWYTPAQEVELFFVEGLQIPCGKAQVPALLWKATIDKLQVYALKSKGRPTPATPLYHAPFFNIYASGQVCMGTVNNTLTRESGLEDFIAAWEQYFLNSYFSHSINGNSSTRSDTIDLWRKLLRKPQPFPNKELLLSGLTLKNLLS